MNTAMTVITKTGHKNELLHWLYWFELSCTRVSNTVDTESMMML